METFLWLFLIIGFWHAYNEPTSITRINTSMSLRTTKKDKHTHNKNVWNNTNWYKSMWITIHYKFITASTGSNVVPMGKPMVWDNNNINLRTLWIRSLAKLMGEKRIQGQIAHKNFFLCFINMKKELSLYT